MVDRICPMKHSKCRKASFPCLHRSFSLTVFHMRNGNFPTGSYRPLSVSLIISATLSSIGSIASTQ